MGGHVKLGLPAEGVGGGSCLPSCPKPCGSLGRCGATWRLKKKPFPNSSASVPIACYVRTNKANQQVHQPDVREFTTTYVD